MSDNGTDTTPLPRFDSLVHVTADGRWLGGDRYDASAARLIRELDRGRIARACLVAIAGYADNDTVLELTRQYPQRLVPIGSFNPGEMRTTTDVEQAVAALAEQGFAGLKLHPRLGGYDPLDDRSLAAIRAAGRHGIPAFICTLFRQRACATLSTPDIVDRLATSCPGTRIVLLHGGASHALDLFELVRMHAHLILDLALTVLRYAGSSLDSDMRFLCQQLDQRVTVGSDFPEYTPGAAFDRIEALTEGLPADKRRRVMHDNLAGLFAAWPGLPGQKSAEQKTTAPSAR